MQPYDDLIGTRFSILKPLVRKRGPAKDEVESVAF
jgi:hypothetical protein